MEVENQSTCEPDVVESEIKNNKNGSESQEIEPLKVDDDENTTKKESNESADKTEESDLTEDKPLDNSDIDSDLTTSTLLQKLEEALVQEPSEESAPSQDNAPLQENAPSQESAPSLSEVELVQASKVMEESIAIGEDSTDMSLQTETASKDEENLIEKEIEKVEEKEEITDALDELKVAEKVDDEDLINDKTEDLLEEANDTPAKTEAKEADKLDAILLDSDDEAIVDASKDAESKLEIENEAKHINDETSKEIEEPPAKRSRTESKDKTESATEVSKIDEQSSDSSDMEKVKDNANTESLLVVSGNRRRSDAENQEDAESSDQNPTPKRPISPSIDDESSDSFKRVRLSPQPSVESTGTQDEETNQTEEAKPVVEEPEKKDEIAAVEIEDKKEEIAELIEEKPKTEALKVSEIAVDPAPEPVPEEKEKVPIEFLKTFKKSFQLMTRRDLEEFLLQKIVEAVIHKSDAAELRQKSEVQENTIIVQRQRINDLTKQFRDLEMVHNRAVKDLETKSQGIVTPVKITRAVGLQVSQPRPPQEKKGNVMYQNAMNQRAPPFPSRSPLRNGQPINLQANMSQKLMGIPLRQNVPMQSAAVISSQFVKKVNVKTTPMRPPLTNAQQVQLEQQQKAQQQQLITLQKQKAMVRQAQFNEQRRIQMQQAQRQSAAPIVVGGTKLTTMVLQPPGNRSMVGQINNQINAPTNGQARSPVLVKKVMGPNRPAPGNSSFVDLTDEEDAIGRQPSHLSGITSNMGNTATKIHVKTPQLLNSSVGAVSVNVGGRNIQVLQGTNENRSPIQRLTSNQFVQIAQKVQPQQPQLQQVRRPIMTSVPKRSAHPAPLPITTNKMHNPVWKKAPPRPQIRINNIESGIVISWTMNEQKLTEDFAEILSYQIYAYQETNQPPATEMWRHVGDVKAMALPMAVTLTQFQEGQRYHFAVRALDEHGRSGLFSVPRTWDEPK